MMLLSYLAAIVLFISYFKKVAISDATVYISREINSVRSALDSLPNKNKVNYLSALVHRNRFYLQAAERPNTAPGSKIDAAISQKIISYIGQSTDLRFQRLADKVVVWVKLSNIKPNYWLGIWANKSQEKFGGRFVAQIIVMLTLSVLGVFWISYRLNKPFKRLMLATKTISQGGTPERIPLSGPKELRLLTETFNNMSRDLAKFDEDRGLMLAGVSHDLRTPLSRLRLALEMLDSNSETDLKNNMVIDLEEMDVIIGQFMSYVEKDSNEYQPPYDLNYFIRELCDRHIRGDDVVKLKLEQTESCKTVIKQISLKRILTNLLDNAISYGLSPIEITTKNLEQELVVFVLDSGTGIPDKELDRLCRPFTRGDDSRANTKGAGLGLAIIKKLCEANNIDFSLTNRAEGGLSARLKIKK